MRFLLVAAIFQLADGTQTAAAGALRGMRDTTAPAVFAFLAYWVLGLPLAAYVAEIALEDAIGVWIAMAIALSLMAAALLPRLAMRCRDPKV